MLHLLQELVHWSLIAPGVPNDRRSFVLPAPRIPLGVAGKTRLYSKTAREQPFNALLSAFPSD